MSGLVFGVNLLVLILTYSPNSRPILPSPITQTGRPSGGMLEVR